MKTYKYKFGDQSNCIRIGNLLDDMWQVHEYFHKWQRQRYKDGLPYANYAAMCAHLTELKRTTHPHWKALPSQAIQQELKRIDKAYQRFFNKLGGRPHIKPRHKFKSITFPGQSGWKLKNNRITLNFRKWEKGKWRYDACLILSTNTANGTVLFGVLQSSVMSAVTIGFTLLHYTDVKRLPTTGQSVGADFGMKGRIFDPEHG